MSTARPTSEASRRHYDWPATLLNCFGLDHTRLVYKRNGADATLTDGQEARVIKELLKQKGQVRFLRDPGFRLAK